MSKKFKPLGYHLAKELNPILMRRFTTKGYSVKMYGIQKLNGKLTYKIVIRNYKRRDKDFAKITHSIESYTDALLNLKRFTDNIKRALREEE